MLQDDVQQKINQEMSDFINKPWGMVPVWFVETFKRAILNLQPDLVPHTVSELELIDKKIKEDRPQLSYAQVGLMSHVIDKVEPRHIHANFSIVVQRKREIYAIRARFHKEVNDEKSRLHGKEARMGQIMSASPLAKA